MNFDVAVNIISCVVVMFAGISDCLIGANACCTFTDFCHTIFDHFFGMQ